MQSTIVIDDDAEIHRDEADSFSKSMRITE